jgi:autotransporter-associated beta strand protein
VDLDSAAPSISHLTFDAYIPTTITSTAAGGGLLTLNNGGNPVAIVVSGSGHVIDRRVTLALESDLRVTVEGSDDSLNIAGSVEDVGAGYSLVKDGSGTLVLSGSNAYMGGTIVDDGTLVVASPGAIAAGTSLLVGADATGLFDQFATASPAEDAQGGRVASMLAVPEPGTLGLLSFGALALGLGGVACPRKSQ